MGYGSVETLAAKGIRRGGSLSLITRCNGSKL